MKQWEYKVIDSKDVAGGGIFKGKDRTEVHKYLNTLGEDGWEIVNLDFRILESEFEFRGVAKREKVV